MLGIFLCVLTVAFSAAAEEEKEWTFLIFLNANNNLDYYGDLNLKQMEEVGSTDKINIVVQWGSMKRPSVKRMLIQKNNSENKEQIISPVIEDLGAVDMGDPNEFLKFLKWGKEKFPAKKYFVSLWNHGNGWYKRKNKTDLHVNDISYDDKTGNKITTEQLGVVLKDFTTELGRKIDVLGSDACLMAMAEVASEVKDSVHYFAGSQEVEPGDGWPYSPFLSEWSQKSEIDGAGVGKILAEQYLKAYSENGVYTPGEVTFSVLDLDRMGDYEQFVASLSKELQTLSSEQLKQSVETAYNTLSFTYSDYKDLGHFLKLLNEKQLVSTETMENYTKTLGQLVISNQVSSAYVEAKGISIWLPDSEWQRSRNAERYEKLKFNQNSGWLEFLRKLEF